MAVLDWRLVKHKGRLATQFLIQWSDALPEDATWEFHSSLEDRFPNFKPWGQGLPQGAQGGGRIITTSAAVPAGSSSLALMGAALAREVQGIKKV
ncbi:hypothetical protein Vadar_023372 [Vaccinium darrowii]|uniref:Uncharacterized protein n=1 Tax=Vaccinium darrowii TaxID=229202 RepID=A0ACB7Z679_9ERIC|nr:hypothetical protein Vadar_023372 [Vaccinium darrowii]